MALLRLLRAENSGGELIKISLFSLKHHALAHPSFHTSTTTYVECMYACMHAFISPNSHATTFHTSRMKIYTKTGDQGTSSLYSGERREKDDAVFDALGNVDELNSVIGVAREFSAASSPSLAAQLEVIQSRLLDVGSAVATPIPTSSEKKLERVAFDASAVGQLERWIDDLTADLPPLTQFILPSGGHASSFLHMARSICRRAERSVVPLTRAQSTESVVAVYLNRLSDYLFTAARAAAKADGKPEVLYKKISS